MNIPLFECEHPDREFIGGTTYRCSRCGAWMDAVPGSRTSDPPSSHRAEHEHTDSGTRFGHKERVFSAVQVFPGSTARELAREIDGINYYEVMRRLNDLADARDRRIRRGEERKCGVSGRRCLTWWPL